MGTGATSKKLSKKELETKLGEMEKEILGKEEKTPSQKKKAPKIEKPKAPEAKEPKAPKVEEPKAAESATGTSGEVTGLVKKMDELEGEKIKVRDALTKRLATLTLRRAALVKRRTEIDAKLSALNEEPKKTETAPTTHDADHHEMTMKRLGSLEKSQGKLMA